MKKIKEEIKKINENYPSTQNYTLSGREWKKLAKNFNLSNKYYLKDNNYYTGGIDLDIRGFKKIVII